MLCRVVSEGGVAADRIRQRDPGISASFLAEVGPAVTDQIDRLRLPGFTVHNNAATSITGLALEVLQRAGWPHPS